MNTRVSQITFAALALVTAAATAADFHVATNGNDADPGTKDKPFATPARAMQAVRALVSDGLKRDVRVELRGGTYALGAPLVFTSADSGSADHAITYAAASGETVVISGGREITNWTAAGGAKWTAELAGVKSGQWFFRQLVVSDQRAVRACWPNEDGVLHLATVGNEVKSFTFDRALPQESLGGQDAELVVYENWSVSRALISFSDQRQLTTATAVGWIGHGDMTTASAGKPAFIEHARVALDQAHEWFLDRSTGTLAYLAAPGEKPTQTVAVAPVLTQLLKIAGTKDKPVRNVRFERLRFEHTDFPLPSTGYSEIQAAHFGPSMKLPTQVQPVAIECAYAEAIRFERCRFAHLNNSGIGFGPGSRRNAVVGCVIEDIGGNGVMVGWRGNGRLKGGAEGTLDADWMDPADAPATNEIANCEIRRCGADSRGAVGIFVAFSADTRVAHNVIHDMPYTGVSIGYRWDTTPTSQVRCVAEYNHIYDVMKTLADGGGIYTLGCQPGTVLRGNLIHDVHRSTFAYGGAPNNGFFIDEGSKGFLFESNVVHKTSGESVRFNQNQREWHTWKGNAFDADATAARIAAAAERAGLEPAYAHRGAELVNLTRDEINDHIRGGWTGMLIGGIEGLAHEFKYIQQPRQELPDYAFLPQGARSDDDNDFEWTHLFFMEKEGVLKIPYPRLVEIWKANMNTGIWCANEQARKLMDKGIVPPGTADPSVNRFAPFNLAGQFCVEAYGMIAPGMPQSAADLGLHYARVSVSGEPLQAAQYWTTLISLAAVSSEPLEELLKKSLPAVDPASAHAEAVREAINAFHRHPTDWKAARQYFHEKWYVPKEKPWDAQARPLKWNDNSTPLNGAMVVLALLYGQGDFYRTGQFAMALGYDADCNAATACAVVGTRIGFSALQKLPQYHMPDRYQNLTRPELPRECKVSDQAALMLGLCEKLILANGGQSITIDGKPGYRIQLQSPRRLE